MNMDLIPGQNTTNHVRLLACIITCVCVRVCVCVLYVCAYCTDVYMCGNHMCMHMCILHVCVQYRFMFAECML